MKRLLKYCLVYMVLLLVSYIVWFVVNMISNNKKEKFSVLDPAPVGYNMSDYDNQPIALKKNKNRLLEKSIYTPQGGQLPLDPKLSKPSKHKQMFLYAKNRCSLDCCPSTYSSSCGCVCETQDQINQIQGK